MPRSRGLGAGWERRGRKPAGDRRVGAALADDPQWSLPCKGGGLGQEEGVLSRCLGSREGAETANTVGVQQVATGVPCYMAS